MPRCEHGLRARECYVCSSPKHGVPWTHPHTALAERLRKIARGEWILKGDEGYLLQAADLLDSITVKP